MQIAIYKEFELQNILFKVTKCNYEKRYKDCGEISLILSHFEDIDDIKLNNFIMIDENCFIIENIKKIKTSFKEKKLEIRGREISSILDRRVIFNKNISAKEPIEKQIYKLINENFVNSSDKKRIVPYLQIDTEKGYGDAIEKDILIDNKTVLEALKIILENINMGIDLKFLPEESKMIFKVYKGRNLSNSIFFSSEFSNISETEITDDNKDYKNTIYYAKGGGYAETENSFGINRRESIEGESLQEAEEILQTKKIASTIEFIIFDNNQYTYGDDWKVGDTVCFYDKQMCIEVEKIVTAVKTFIGNATELEVILGDRILSPFEKMKRS